MRNFMSKDRRRRSESSRDSINVTNKIQHGFSCEGPVNHYGSPITGREGTFRLPRRVWVFTGLVYSTFILQPSRANGSKKISLSFLISPDVPMRTEGGWTGTRRLDQSWCMCVVFSEISVDNVEKIDKLLSRFVFIFFLILNVETNVHWEE